MRTNRRDFIKATGAAGTGLVAGGLTYCITDRKNIVLENSYLRYETDAGGNNLHFIDKASGNDLLDKKNASYCAYIIKDGDKYLVDNVSQIDGRLHFEFGDSGVSADLSVEIFPDRIFISLISVSGNPDSVTFSNIPLDVDRVDEGRFAACLLSMNLQTHVSQLPAIQNHLSATSYEHTGLENGSFALLALPQDKIIEVIRDVISHSKEIPFSDQGGAWAKDRKAGYGSYLFVRDLTENTVDDIIERCKSLGFNQVLVSSARHGDFFISKEQYPDGWLSFRRINEKIHAAGLSTIFHMYSFFIDKRAEYVTPVPSEDLGYFKAFTLSRELSPDDNEIEVTESTTGMSATTGFWVRNSKTVRIGDELIEFSGVTQAVPYKFTGCKRGVHGTKISGHSVNEKVFHLKEMFGRFLPAADTKLFSKIASDIAGIVDTANFDGIYFDAIDGSDLFEGDAFYWHYGPKFVFEVARNLKTMVGMEMAGMTHLWWHYRSRWQAWDYPTKGFKKFIDIHLASIKSYTYKHGEFRGNTPVISKFAGKALSPLMLPLHLGWWRNQVWDPPQTERTMPDDLEYICCKMAGNNAGLSMTGGTEINLLTENPLLAKLNSIIKKYEELRHAGYFSESVLEKLRQPGKEFTLIKDSGRWNFRQVSYKKHKVADDSHPTAAWQVNNEFESQPVKLRIEPLMTIMPYNHSKGILLSDFSDASAFKEQEKAKGVSGKMSSENEGGPGFDRSSRFSAFSAGDSPQDGSWICMEKSFEAGADLDKHQGLGLWVKGDGSGQILNVGLRSPVHLNGGRGDHFIRIDFTGWRYFELVENESDQFSDYLWPDHHLYVYRTYRHQLYYNNIEKLQLWFNNLPAGREVSCMIGPVKALPLASATLNDPAIAIGGEEITFPGTIKSGEYIEFRSKDDCKLFTSKGQFIRDIAVKGDIPILKKDSNDVSFKCNNNTDYSSRVQVTVIAEGELL